MTAPNHLFTDPAQADDERLRAALRGLAPDAPAARVEALSERVMAQWHDAHRAEPAEALASSGGTWRLTPGRSRRATWWIGFTGVSLGLALAVASWVRVPDPSIDELLQPDVLSQMAAGEM